MNQQVKEAYKGQTEVLLANVNVLIKGEGVRMRDAAKDHWYTGTWNGSDFIAGGDTGVPTTLSIVVDEDQGDHSGPYTDVRKDLRDGYTLADRRCRKYVGLEERLS